MKNQNPISRLTNVLRLVAAPQRYPQNGSFRRSGTSRILRFVGWQLYKRLPGCRPFGIVLSWGRRFKAYPGCEVSQDLVVLGGHHFFELSYLEAQLDGGSLIDIGANVGSIALLLAHRFDHGLLFEANPAAAQRARENLALNQLPWTVVEMAVSDHEGALTFSNHGGTSTTNRVLSPGTETIAVGSQIPCTSLDSYLSEHPESMVDPISLIKIDVEGHELPVLEGMRATLIQRRPRFLLFEKLARLDMDKVIDFFDEIRYTVLDFDPKGGVQCFRAERAAPWVSNLIAVPNENLDALPPSWSQQTVL